MVKSIEEQDWEVEVTDLLERMGNDVKLMMQLLSDVCFAKSVEISKSPEQEDAQEAQWWDEWGGFIQDMILDLEEEEEMVEVITQVTKPATVPQLPEPKTSVKRVRESKPETESKTVEEIPLCALD